MSGRPVDSSSCIRRTAASARRTSVVSRSLDTTHSNLSDRWRSGPSPVDPRSVDLPTEGIVDIEVSPNMKEEYVAKDQLDLMICPIVIGEGQRLFGDGGASLDLQLAGHADLATGVVILSYQPQAASTS